MRRYTRKTRDLFLIYLNYGLGFWEHETTEFSKADAAYAKAEYEKNCPEYLCKIVHKRERIHRAM